MTAPKSPNGYANYERFNSSRTALYSTKAILLILSGVIIFTQDVILYPQSYVKLVVAVGIAIMASLYIHESLHYVANSVLGYEPVFKWPNGVYVPNASLGRWESIIVLLAPQLLTFVYVLLLISGAVKDLEIIIGWGLILNLGGASSDISWVVRRLSWPAETKIIVGEDMEDYVAFPQDSV